MNTHVRFSIYLPNNGKPILYVMDLSHISRAIFNKDSLQDFMGPKKAFPALFCACLIFKDFSEKPSIFKHFSSLRKPYVISYLYYNKSHYKKYYYIIYK